jgi:apyrase
MPHNAGILILLSALPALLFAQSVGAHQAWPGFAAGLPAHLTVPASNATYGLLFDAGSSGTRLSVYVWPTRVFSELPPALSVPLELVYFSQRTSPSLDKPGGIAVLQVLLGQAMQYLASVSSPALFGSYPMFLTATAGMRILEEPVRFAVMEAARDALAASPFLFNRAWARVIPGEEEGVYGWIASNYAQGTLLSNASAGTSGDGSGGVSVGNNTYGAIDLGGASAQISFIPPAGVDAISNAYRVDLTTTASALVYTHSFLYFGVNEGTARINELVVAEWAVANPGSTVARGMQLAHPCYLLGTPLRLTNYTSTAVAPGVMFNFLGTSNATECSRLATTIMMRASYCLTDPKPTPVSVSVAGVAAPVALPPAINPNATGSTCSINGVYQPPLTPPLLPGMNGSSGRNVTFYAFSFFAYMWPFFGLPSGAPLSQLQAAVAAFCALDYATANATFYSRTTLPTSIPEYCLTGSFGSALLAVGFKIPTDSSFVTVPASPFSYASGAMLVAVNQLAWALATNSLPTSAQPDGRAVIAAGVMGGALAAGLLGLSCFALLSWRRRRVVTHRMSSPRHEGGGSDTPYAFQPEPSPTFDGNPVVTTNALREHTVNNSRARTQSELQLPEVHRDGRNSAGASPVPSHLRGSA